MGISREQIKKELISAIQSQMGIDPAALSEESRFDELNISSLDAFNIFGDIEENFDVELPYEELEGIETLKDAIDAFERFATKSD